MKHLVSQEWIDNASKKYGVAFHNGKLVGKFKTNPCVTAFGQGTLGVTCKMCIHIKRYRTANTYIKCDLRPYSHGPGTDHKVSWQSCAKYEVSPTPNQSKES